MDGFYFYSLRAYGMDGFFFLFPEGVWIESIFIPWEHMD